MTQHDLSLGEIMRIYPPEVADTSLAAVRFCNVMVIMQSVSGSVHDGMKLHVSYIPADVF